MLMPTKILVPTDFSTYSDKALRQAFDIAKQYNAKVYVIHVVHEKITDTIDDYGILRNNSSNITGMWLADIHSLLMF